MVVAGPPSGLLQQRQADVRATRGRHAGVVVFVFYTAACKSRYTGGYPGCCHGVPHCLEVSGATKSFLHLINICPRGFSLREVVLRLRPPRGERRQHPVF